MHEYWECAGVKEFVHGKQNLSAKPPGPAFERSIQKCHHKNVIASPYPWVPRGSRPPSTPGRTPGFRRPFVTT
eukprot:1061280-Amorphochlora_amoeboformis.AAC.1